MSDQNLTRGRRLRAARAYLHPVLDRPNVTVRTLAQATPDAGRFAT